MLSPVESVLAPVFPPLEAGAEGAGSGWSSVGIIILDEGQTIRRSNDSVVGGVGRLDVGAAGCELGYVAD